MDYFKILNLNKEPFSNSPDPDFFFHSQQHVECLQKIELSLRLRRGLSVVIGDVGTGKTTLCRQLIRKFAGEEDLETHLILDPYFSTERELLSTVAEMFGEYCPKNETSDWQLKEIIKKYLFRRGVDEGATVILIIDEGQKLLDFCLEIFREFLNYETNEYKLLQIVIFAQKEFEQSLEKHQNFADRINLFHILGPLNFHETRSMIRFRLERASEGKQGLLFFSFPALWAIYRGSGGYPRKIINLCHQVIMTVIVQNRSRAGWSLARSCIKRDLLERPKNRQRARIGALTGLLVVVFLFALAPEHFTIPRPWENERDASMSQVVKSQIRVRPPDIKQASSQPPQRGTARGEPTNTGRPASDTTPGITPVKAPEFSSEIPGHEPPPPGILGEITAGKNETLGEMIYKVYGIYTNKCLRSVAECNQKIRNPDLITAGQVIRFPALPVKVSPSSLNFCWVRITSEESLEDAYWFLKIYSSSAAPIKIIPCWNGRDGLRFIILLKEYFSDEASARNTMKELPPIFVSGAKVLADWDEDTIFFANPVF